LHEVEGRGVSADDWMLEELKKGAHTEADLERWEREIEQLAWRRRAFFWTVGVLVVIGVWTVFYLWSLV